MIEAVFFSRFHPEKGSAPGLAARPVTLRWEVQSADLVPGPIVSHQVPDGSVQPNSPLHAPLFDFNALAEFIIPRQEFCDSQLSVSAGSRRIVGHPVCIASPHYPRNEFIFNFALVLPQHVDSVPYAKVTRRVALLLREAEETERLLSDDEGRLDAPSALSLDSSVAEPLREPLRPASRVHALCEMLMQDLNSYDEAMLPLDAARVLNLALRPTPHPPPPVHYWHVPIAARPLEQLVCGPGWDLAIVGLATWIDGRRSVARIADCGNADVAVARRAVTCLVAAGLVKLLDIFQYGAVYVPNPGIRRILLDTKVQRRAMAAVTENGSAVDPDQLSRLYASLSHGVTLKTWCQEHLKELHEVNVRQFVAWGLLEGFIYRVHEYVVSEVCKKDEGLTKIEVQSASKPIELPPVRYLHGLHCFDCICTTLQLSRNELHVPLRGLHGVHIIEK